jgi:hypothetical protein
VKNWDNVTIKTLTDAVNPRSSINDRAFAITIARLLPTTTKSRLAKQRRSTSVSMLITVDVQS